MMPDYPSIPNLGRQLAERLGVAIIGTEAHDLKGPCIACGSSDAMRIHLAKGCAHCFSCGKAWSPFDFAKVVLRDHQAAIRLMQDLGVFAPTTPHPTGAGENGHAATCLLPSPVVVDPIEAICREKSIPSADALKVYGARLEGNAVVLPMIGADLQICSAFKMIPGGGKGLNAKGRPTGLFLPSRSPECGEKWCLVEGCKDAATLFSLGYLTAGLPGNRLKAEFAPLFKDTDVVIVPDADFAGDAGAEETAKLLRGVARSVRIASLPVEHRESGGKDVRDALREKGADAVREAIENASPDGKTGAIDYKPMTCAELMAADFPIRFLVEKLLVAVQPCIVAGPKKALKTSLLLDLALSLATAGDFLGKFRVPTAVAVGVMTGESGMATIQETINRIGLATGCNPSTITNLYVTDRVPQFSSPEHLNAVRAFISDKKLEVLVIDPAYLCIDGTDAGNLFAQGKELRGMSEVCQGAGCGLVLCHHTRKGVANPYAPPELEDIAWAGFQEFARQWLLVNRREPYVPGTGDHRLWLSCGGSVGHGGLWGVDIHEGLNRGFWRPGLASVRSRHQRSEGRYANPARCSTGVLV